MVCAMVRVCHNAKIVVIVVHRFCCCAVRCKVATRSYFVSLSLAIIFGAGSFVESRFGRFQHRLGWVWVVLVVIAMYVYACEFRVVVVNFDFDLSLKTWFKCTAFELRVNIQQVDRSFGYAVWVSLVRTCVITIFFFVRWTKAREKQFLSLSSSFYARCM